MTAPLTLAAIRFSDDVPAMRRFLETIGLSTATSRGDDWVVLDAGQGQVWLHSAKTSNIGAPNGETNLTGEVDDLDAAALAFKERGLTPTIVDEAYARTLELDDPHGRTLVLHDHGDPYGYDQHASEPDVRVTVSMCRFTDPQGPYAAFAEALGLARDGDANEWYVPYSAGTGILGLHHDDGTNDLPDSGAGPAVTLGLTTSIPLDEVQQRLRDGGYAAGEIVVEDFGSHVETVDPDGRPFLIHAA